MASIPSLRLRAAKYRQATSSHEQNQMHEETLFDLNNLFNLVNEQETLLNQVKEITSVENKYQSIRIQNLEHELQVIQNLYYELKQANGKYQKRIYVDRMLPDLTVGVQEQAQIDTYHSLVTLPVTGRTQSKVYLYDSVTKEIVLPPTLGIQVVPEADGSNIIDNDVHYAFNGDNADIWCRKYVFTHDDPTVSVTTEMTITLPDNIISNRDINTLLIHPFPLSTVDIDKVEYRLDGGWTLLPSWPKDDAGNPLSIQDAGNMKFCFGSLPMAEVRVTLTQRNFIVEGHKKIFYVGAQEIGVAYTDYQAGIGRFVIPATLEGKSQTKLITSLRPIFANEEALSDKSVDKRSLFNYSIYTVDKQGALQYTKDTLPIMVTTDDILIKAHISVDPQTGATPALECVEVTYEDLV